jgi:transposase
MAEAKPVPEMALESAPGPERGEASRAVRGQRRLKPVERRQLLLRTVDVEKWVAEDHPVRAIWALLGELDLERFSAEIKAVEGRAGRSAFDPQLLASLWIYAYSRGVSSAREISRLCEYHPAYQWLAALEVPNHHTLSDFRIQHQQALDELFTEVLGVLSEADLITLERVRHDGTKVKACASSKSFRREERLRAHLELARQQVQQMGDPRSEELPRRVAQARQRALKEKQQRLASALEQLEQIRAPKSSPSEHEQARASSTDPDARILLQSNGGYDPSYNVQISTDAQARLIVGVGVSQAANDAAELPPAVERVEANLEQVPAEVVVDSGFTNQTTIVAMAAKRINLIGALPDRSAQTVAALESRGVAPAFFPQAFAYDAAANSYTCPAGQRLKCEGREKQGESLRYRYRAPAAACQSCPFKAQCCPDTAKGRSLVRTEDSAVVAAFKAKMQTPEAQAVLKQRAGVAEFPNAWIKQKLGLRQFRLRGLGKVGLEALWACLTYNIQQWIRLLWRPQRARLQAAMA